MSAKFRLSIYRASSIYLIQLLFTEHHRYTWFSYYLQSITDIPDSVIIYRTSSIYLIQLLFTEHHRYTWFSYYLQSIIGIPDSVIIYRASSIYLIQLLFTEHHRYTWLSCYLQSIIDIPDSVIIYRASSIYLIQLLFTEHHQYTWFSYYFCNYKLLHRNKGTYRQGVKYESWTVHKHLVIKWFQDFASSPCINRRNTQIWVDSYGVFNATFNTI
jgi:hypothetical protein